MRTVIALYSKTTTIVQPWLDVGFHAVLVDLQHNEGERTEGNVTYIGADMLDWFPPKWLVKSDVALVAAFPPCDHLAVSGARWFAGKGLGKLAHSVKLFERAAYWSEWFEAPYFIENPVSTISSYWRKPDHTFHPWQYTGLVLDDNYTKQTCAWTGNGFVMPEPNIHPVVAEAIAEVEARFGRMVPRVKAIESFGKSGLVADFYPDNRIHNAPPSDERSDFRSATPAGFSRAVFKSNWIDKVFGKDAA